MKKIANIRKLLRHDRTLRIIGFDDAPFVRENNFVHICGVVTARTRFEGMLWGEAIQDGWDATELLIQLVQNSKFHAQVHAILLDGIAFGGFNIVDLQELSEHLQLPCITVMRKRPDLVAIERALQNLSDPARRMKVLRKAGPIYEADPFVFQIKGITRELAVQLLHHVTDTGNVPEALRLAHLIGAAVKTGESSNRA